MDGGPGYVYHLLFRDKEKTRNTHSTQGRGQLNMLEDQVGRIIKELEEYLKENEDIADEPQIREIRKAVKHLKLSNAVHQEGQ